MDTLDSYLDDIERFLLQQGIPSKAVDHIITDIEKFIKETETAIDKYYKDLEKFLKELEKYLDKMDQDGMERLFYKLLELVLKVDIGEDGEIIIGDDIFEWDDLVGMCCPWG